jgi:hypothetical protein
MQTEDLAVWAALRTIWAQYKKILYQLILENWYRNEPKMLFNLTKFLIISANMSFLYCDRADFFLVKPDELDKKSKFYEGNISEIKFCMEYWSDSIINNMGASLKAKQFDKYQILVFTELDKSLKPYIRVVTLSFYNETVYLRVKLQLVGDPTFFSRIFKSMSEWKYSDKLPKFLKRDDTIIELFKLEPYEMSYGKLALPDMSFSNPIVTVDVDTEILDKNYKNIDVVPHNVESRIHRHVVDWAHFSYLRLLLAFLIYIGIPFLLCRHVINTNNLNKI